MPLKVFLSHSQKRSHILANGLRDFLPLVIQRIRPFVSEADIGEGRRWLGRLSGELQDTKFGIVCVTPENRHSRWLHYEAGAIAKSVTDSCVCPVLLGVDANRVKLPISQFQCVAANRDGIRKLVRRLNETLSDDRLDDYRLQRTFDAFWPDLETIIQGLTEQQVPIDIYALLELTEDDDDIEGLRMAHLMAPFPEFLEELNEKLGAAKKEIKILVDHACYSHFSAEKLGQAYIQCTQSPNSLQTQGPDCCSIKNQTKGDSEAPVPEPRKQTLSSFNKIIGTRNFLVKFRLRRRAENQSLP